MRSTLVAWKHCVGLSGMLVEMLVVPTRTTKGRLERVDSLLVRVPSFDPTLPSFNTTLERVLPDSSTRP